MDSSSLSFFSQNSCLNGREESAGFQPLRFYVCCRFLLVSFSTSADVRRSRLMLAGHFRAASSWISHLPPLPPLLHLAELLGKQGFQCRNEFGDDFGVIKTNLWVDEIKEIATIFKWKHSELFHLDFFFFFYHLALFILIYTLYSKCFIYSLFPCYSCINVCCW